MDPCECVCCYVWAMRRLMSWLQTQNHCSDTECFTEHPGFQGAGGPDSTGMQLALVLVVWLLIAVVLFAYRPKSLRPSADHKPRIQPRDDGPTPPPLH